MAGPDEYVQEAIELIKKALAAEKIENKQLYLSLAAQWCRLAEETDAPAMVADLASKVGL